MTLDMDLINILQEPWRSGVSCCRTPGAIYTTTVRPRLLSLDVSVPEKLSLFDRISEERKRKLIADLHAAILPVIEGVYRDTWDHVAGQNLPDCSNRPMPERWEDLAPPAMSGGAP